MDTTLLVSTPVTEKQLKPFERYLTIWVGLCMVAGVLLGQAAPSFVHALRTMEFGMGSHINLPITILIGLMIMPMMMKIDLALIRHLGARPTGLLVTLFVNWVIKPFSMAFLAWLFFRMDFAAGITPPEADQYFAGAMILAAAPCAAMVFVWSYLTDGDSADTLVQLAINDLIPLLLFAPIVAFLAIGASSLSVPFDVLLYSVLAFIVIPLIIGWAFRTWLVRQGWQRWLEDVLLPRYSPGTIAVLLLTLVFIFAFQAQNIFGKTFHAVLIVIPILVQVYVNVRLAYWLMYRFRVSYAIAAPGASSAFLNWPWRQPSCYSVRSPVQRWLRS